MKNVIVVFLFLILSAGQIYANKYETAMASAIEELYSSKELESYMEASAKFERIGAAEQTKWLPFYYAGLGYIWASHQTKDPTEIDGYLDKAQAMVDAAAKLSPNNDEIVTLQGYIYMMKVVVDPPARGPEYSGMAMQQFGKAVGINPNNPRALSLQGRMQMGTDQFFGNNITSSCKIISKAVEMFENQKSESPLDPSWGKEMTLSFYQECQAN